MSVIRGAFVESECEGDPALSRGPCRCRSGLRVRGHTDEGARVQRLALPVPIVVCGPAVPGIGSTTP